MNEITMANLIPFSQRSEEEQRRIKSKGGSSTSPLKSVAAKLRWMRQTGKIDDNTHAILHDMMVSSEAAHFEVLKFLMQMRKNNLSFQEQREWSKLMMEWIRNHHGKPINNNIMIGNNNTMDVRDYKFIIEDVSVPDVIEPSKVEDHKEAENSPELPQGQTNN